MGITPLRDELIYEMRCDLYTDATEKSRMSRKIKKNP